MKSPAKTRTQRKDKRFPTRPQEQTKHPSQWEADLNPHSQEGQNIGRHSISNDPHQRTAADLKELTEKLSALRNDELAQIPIVPAGTQLKQGAVYLDLNDPELGPIKAEGGMTAGEDNYFVPKREVSYEHWNRLLELLAPAGMQTVPPSSDERNTSNPAASAARISESMIDETIAESFPTSDPPSWTTGRDHTQMAETRADDLQNLSDQELRQKATELNVPGRDSMNREQLILAIRGQSSGTEV